MPVARRDRLVRPDRVAAYGGLTQNAPAEDAAAYVTALVADVEPAGHDDVNMLSRLADAVERLTARDRTPRRFGAKRRDVRLRPVTQPVGEERR